MRDNFITLISIFIRELSWYIVKVLILIFFCSVKQSHFHGAWLSLWFLTFTILIFYIIPIWNNLFFNLYQTTAVFQLIVFRKIKTKGQKNGNFIVYYYSTRTPGCLIFFFHVQQIIKQFTKIMYSTEYYLTFDNLMIDNWSHLISEGKKKLDPSSNIFHYSIHVPRILIINHKSISKELHPFK